MVPVRTDAGFWLVLVLMVLLFAINIVFELLKKKLAKHQQISLEHLEDCIVFFDEN